MAAKKSIDISKSKFPIFLQLYGLLLDINIEKLYKNTLYNFSTLNLSTNYFNLVNLDVLNLNKIDISHDLFLNNYNNLYYIFENIS